MCVIAVAWRAHPRWPLIVAANRDEFLDRATAPADWWPDDPRVLAGRDLVAGGTWMGITRDGRFAGLTNVRDPRAPAGARSRGGLVSDWLTGPRDSRPMDAARAAHADGDRYGGFHLLQADLAPVLATGRRLPGAAAPDEAFSWTCNRGPGAPRPIGPGVHAWSNGDPDHDWPKTRHLRSALDAALSEALADEAVEQRLLDSLADDRVAPDHLLPDTGVGLERERWLSALFVRSAAYGTRSSTVLRIDARGNARWVERTFTPESPPRDRRQAFRLEGASEA